jgi:hypothetical protein
MIEKIEKRKKKNESNSFIQKVCDLGHDFKWVRIDKFQRLQKKHYNSSTPSCCYWDNKTIKKMGVCRMKAIVTQVFLSFDDVVSILSGFNSYSSYWVSLVDWEDDEYHEARNNVSERHDDDSPCLEDVWAEMLFMGRKLWISDEEGVNYDLTLDNLKQGVIKAFDNGVSMDIDLWDASDCDVVIQCAIFGEAIYG